MNDHNQPNGKAPHYCMGHEDNFGQLDIMEHITDGSILSPTGFTAGYSHCGIKSSDPDVGLIVSERPCNAAGVFTQNQFAAAPVQWCRSILPSTGLHAIVVNAGNANACTGEQGQRDSRRSAEIVADMCQCDPEQVAVASTGIIGHPLPMDKLESGITSAHSNLSARTEAARGAEQAILTTDTFRKACAVKLSIGGQTCCIGGMAKGSGMIHPNMATMLGFITTDAEVPVDLLQKCLETANEVSFNRISVDGDTSTNDSVFMLANGNSGIEIQPDTPASKTFQNGLQTVMQCLAQSIARDGEGATKLIEIQVSGARNEADADRAARAIANSPLVKCAINGGDPNWGRIVCAAGYSGAEFSPENVRLQLGSTEVFADGLPTDANAADELAGTDVMIQLELGEGPGTATMWTCDLSQDYVEINAEYHT